MLKSTGSFYFCLINYVLLPEIYSLGIEYLIATYPEDNIFHNFDGKIRLGFH